MKTTVHKIKHACTGTLKHIEHNMDKNVSKFHNETVLVQMRWQNVLQNQDVAILFIWCPARVDGGRDLSRR